MADNKIYYTTDDGHVYWPYSDANFGATIVSNGNPIQKTTGVINGIT